MRYNTVADSIYTKKLCSRLSSIECNLGGKRPVCVFKPPFGGLGATLRTYYVHIRLIEKRVHWTSDIGLNLTFFAKCYGRGATSEYRF